MAWTRYQKFLAVMMVVTGSINTLSTNWADKTVSVGSDGQEHLFDHPFLQAAAMFLGEILCLVAFKLVQFKTRNSGGHSLTEGSQDFNPLILLPAAMFDLIGTSVMYVGLTLTYVSSFQMFRGSIIVFVAVLSTVFLDRHIRNGEWMGIVNVIFGLIIVGATDAIYQNPGESKGRNSLITGDLLIVAAQVISACQMVYEERYVAGLNIPSLQAVGWEGVFGFSAASVLMVIFYWIPAPPHFDHNPRGTVEDFVDGFVQIANSTVILTAFLGMILSIAVFNFAGISVTKEMSATTRMVLDSVRTLVIWIFSLSLRWQSFHWQHLIGFSVLTLGMCQYNRILPKISISCCGWRNQQNEDVENAASAEADRLDEN
ncbi:solute carrier family 35 member F6 [Leptidea sinapis]|uniref:EamA domain-containing protein n=1 Tax=Leptidea sinapis TaxID=189913 RepID=A0A5E4R7P4_9NEOP|nr:solute carrier family 35 member F6 [Leptidea sinapis]VVD05976.1 unnamed protein product [Leptidea sinapis]